MKVIKVKHVSSNQLVLVADCFVDSGYLQGLGGSLPDVDNDFQSDRRQEVKEYIERRYNINGRQRVFSAGTMTTLKMKAVIKDVARTMRIPVSLVNYITAIFEDDRMTYTDLFKFAATNKKVAKFIEDYPQLFEDIRTLMFQPRSSSVHASALLVTPDERDGEPVDAWDYTPIKKVDGMLVSEFDGYQLDECGLLKNDCLATKELSKLQQTMNLCNQEYGTNLSLEMLATSECDEPRVYELLRAGYTQNVFQLSSRGMTKFIKELQPTNINDLIAANALFRPATLENGTTTDYVDCKRGDRAPVYLWGTHDILKKTYGLCVYQEDIVAVARKVGGFTLAEGVRLVKFISKKKIDKILALKDKFMDGAKANGCPLEDAEALWKIFESAGKYAFNASHATAYAVTSYVGAYLKAKYPTAFYTIALQWANDDELVPLMSEMELCSNAKVVPPDINHSEASFYTDFSTDRIFWSLSSIKMLGVKAVDWIVAERKKNGEFTSIGNFIDRVFKYKLKKYEYWDDPDNEEEAQRCPVNARHVRNLILAGCFDKVEKAMSVVERYAILEKAAEHLGFEVNDKDYPADLIGKHYFWSQQQIKVSGLGAIDYRRVFDNSDIKPLVKGYPFLSFRDVADDENDGKKVSIAATVVDAEEKKFKSTKTNKTETLCKITLQQNNDICECTVWPEEYDKFRPELTMCKNKLIVFSGIVKYSDYLGKNQLQFTRNTKCEII